MNFPDDLRYTQNDEWIRVEGDLAYVGISDYAQDQLSDVVYVEITVSEGDSLSQGDSFGTVESVKAASDVYSPVSGEVVEINDTLEDTPEIINDEPYGAAWMLQIKLSDPSELDELMDAEAYKAHRSE